MEDQKNKRAQGEEYNNRSLRKGDDGKSMPATTSKGYVTGGENPAVRPEQGPDVPPQERTEGIP